MVILKEIIRVLKRKFLIRLHLSKLKLYRRKIEVKSMDSDGKAIEIVNVWEKGDILVIFSAIKTTLNTS